MPRARLLLCASFFTAAGLAAACSSTITTPERPMDLSQKDKYTIKGAKSLIDAYPAVNPDQSINVVVEIPAGTNDKWEVRESDGALVWEFTGDKPRVIPYLPYIGNYGLIPRTLLDAAGGGDGSALDVLVLGPRVPRGSVVRATPIGVIHLLDRSEQDDKVLAVMRGSPLESAVDVESLDAHFPGVTDIIRIWFANYSGGQDIIYMGLGPRASARRMIDLTAAAYQKSH